MILIDSNVLIDIFGPDQLWYQWSFEAAAKAGTGDQLAINVVTVAEVAPRLGSLDVFMQKVAIIGVEVVEMTNESAFAPVKRSTSIVPVVSAGKTGAGRYCPISSSAAMRKPLAQPFSPATPAFTAPTSLRCH